MRKPNDAGDLNNINCKNWNCVRGEVTIIVLIVALPILIVMITIIIIVIWLDEQGIALDCL